MESGGSLIKTAIEDSQKIMASLLFDFQKALNCPVWITGYSEMKNGGIFGPFTEEIKKIYSKSANLKNKLFIYRHFSMNQFTIDLKKQSLHGEPVKKCLKRIGVSYRNRILGQI
jgi:hypothetical protein